ncbi:hypothetical protein Ocin01_16360 [Orchesella cincta]|uniref:Protein Star n=1 Tax=Orchesella cincta TaxID=48709 RepID=A0A1D2MBH6_ORCCI|nr:hypothetical protein Ocin01_16360 [Orchesella cincta]
MWRNSTSSGPRPPGRKLTLLLLILVVLFGFIYYLHVISHTSLLNGLIYKPKYQWRPEFSELNGPDISSSDSRVIEKLKRGFLTYPNEQAYNLSEPWESDVSMGQSQVIRKVFHDQLKANYKGFFVECGALDGETRSNTLYLERYAHWAGLLIEADPSNFQSLKFKFRKAVVSNTCLSTKSYPVMVSFEQNSNQGKVSSFGVGVLEKNHVDVQCFSLITGRADILKTIDFKALDISSLSVEFIHDVEGKNAIKEHMVDNGYFVLTEVTHPNWLANDFMFVKKSFFDGLSSKVKSELEEIRESYIRDGPIVSGDKRLFFD